MNRENLKILIVDDFDPMRNMIRNDLLIRGYTQFYSVDSGSEALQICEEETIDLIITGSNLHGVSGLELTKSIRLAEKTQNIPVLMAMTDTDTDLVNEAISAGVNDFMVSPFTPKVLYQKLDSIFSGKSPFIKKPVTTDVIDGSVVVKPVPKPSAKGEAKILVVDDVPSNIDVIVGTLNDSYKIQAATSGKKALKIASSTPLPDLILLDIMMPEMDGMEVCRELKNNPLTMDIPVIFLTAKADAETAVEGFALGAVDYITKPVNPELLKARVHNHVALKKSQDSLKNQVNTLMDMARLREDVERMSQHDIKKPLGFIIDQLASLQDGQGIDAQDSETLKEVQASAVSILDIVNNSLNLYKMESSNYQLAPEAVDIVKVIKRVRDDLSHAYSEELAAKNVSIELENMDDEIVMVKGEELLCYTLLSNVLKNALEASEPGEKIDLSIFNQDQIIVDVHNKAEIPKTVQAGFFNKYVSHGKSGGTGLGTYSAKLMAEVQNGSIDFTSSADEGTTISVKLPEWGA